MESVPIQSQVSNDALLATYTLRTIDNQALPFQIDPGVQVTAGTLTLNGNGTFSLALMVSAGGQTASGTATGSYSRTGNSFRFRESDDDCELTMTFSGGNTMTLIDPDDGSVWVFRK
jgi:hypothetical protein